METTLVTTSKQTAHDLIAFTAMPGDAIKREMDANYLAMLVEEHPNLDKKYFIDFIHKAQLTGADPRLNQIYLVVHDTWNAATQSKIPMGTVIHDYKFMMMKAEQTGELDEKWVDIVEDPYLDIQSGRKRPSWTAAATVIRKGKKTVFKARFWEYVKLNKDGSIGGNWKGMPMFMLEKCAMASALRWAFPESLGSIYVHEEMERVIAQESMPVQQIAPRVTPPQPIQIAPQAPVAPQVIDNEQAMVTVSAEFETAPELDLTTDEMREELCRFLSAAKDEFFTSIGKNRGVMLSAVLTAKEDNDIRRQYRWMISIVKGQK